jgi:HK97 family phage portal protein
MTSTDLEILNTRKYGVVEIARIFRVPLTKIYSESNNTYNAGETANVEFLVDTIDPILTKLEQELETKLLGTNPRTAMAYRIIFDRDKMFTVNSITKADYYLKMEQAGIYSPNDLRQKENMPAVAGGDTPLISCNVAPIGSAKITGENNSGQPQTGKSNKE